MSDSGEPLVLAREGTDYQGPVVVITRKPGGRLIRLVRPADPDRLLDDPVVLDWNRRDDYMPYWAYLWPAAYLLAEAVLNEHWPEPETAGGPVQALEIGCGLGLPGLAAVSKGLQVLFTDYDRAPLEFVARSAAENGVDPSRFAIRLLDWRNFPDEQFSVILGADVIYEAPLVPLVANLLANLLAPGGLGLIATPLRVTALAFPAALASVGLGCRPELKETRLDDGRLIHGTLYRVTHARS